MREQPLGTWHELKKYNWVGLQLPGEDMKKGALRGLVHYRSTFPTASECGGKRVPWWGQAGLAVGC